MGRKASDAQRAKLIESFRTDPEPGTHASFRRAAVAAELDWRTCRRAWAAGWPGVPAIRDTLASERVLARAHLRKEALASRLEAAAALAQEDAAESRAKGGQLVRFCSTAVLNTFVAMHQEKVYEYQRLLLRLMKDEKDPSSPLAVVAQERFDSIAKTIARLVSAASDSQQLERLLLGEPTSILGGEIGIRPVTPVTADASTLAVELERAQRALDELRQIEARKETPDARPGNGLPQ
jgi:hypothetical protein